MSYSADVSIVGGGPVGSLLAVLLRDMGLEVVVVERDLQPYQLPRAIVMDDEIQRLFHQHGMGAELSQITTTLPGAEFVDVGGKRILGVDIPPVGLHGLPPVVCHYQPELDAMVQAQAESRGSIFVRGRWAETLDVLSDQIVLTLDDESTVESRWLVGCDGASSWTRRATGLTLEDLRFDQQWLVVDLELHEDHAATLPAVLQQVCDPHRPVTFVPGHARYRRWEFQIQPDEDVDALLHPDGLWSLLDGWLSPHDARIIRSAAYRFHAVVAPMMQNGPVFLAGDSGHQMPPFLGQGLNAGSRDAANLAWKLAFVHHGRSQERLLETYSTERVPHVRSTVEHAADMGRLIDQLAGRESHGLDHSSGYGGKRPQPSFETGLIVSGHHYVGRPFPYQRQVYDSLRINGASFVIATTDSAIMVPDSLETWVSEIVQVDGDLIDNMCAAIIRPDGYVAAMAKDRHELETVALRLRELS